MAILTKANKDWFVEQVVRNTPDLDASKHIDFFRVPSVYPLPSIGSTSVNLSTHYTNLIIPKMLPEHILDQVCHKNMFKLHTAQINIENFLYLLPEHLRVPIADIRRVTPAYPPRTYVSEYNRFVHATFSMSLPIYFQEGIPRDGYVNLETSSSYRNAVKTMIEENEEELLEIKDNISKISEIMRNTDKIKCNLRDSIKDIRTREALREAFPKLAQFVPKEISKRPTVKMGTEEEKRYAIIDSLLNLGFTPKTTAE